MCLAGDTVVDGLRRRGRGEGSSCEAAASAASKAIYDAIDFVRGERSMLLPSQSEVATFNYGSWVDKKLKESEASNVDFFRAGSQSHLA